MKMRRAVLIVLVAPVILACEALSLPALPTAAPTSRADPTSLHFEDQWVAFDYSQGLEVYEGLDPSFKWSLDVDVGGEQVVGLGDSQARANGVYLCSIRITHRGLPADQDVQKMMKETYDSFETLYDTYEPLMALPQTILVDNLPAYQKSYRIFWGEPAYDLRDVWVPHNEALYIVAILVRWSNPDALAEFNAVADRILRSLVIK